MGVVKVEYILVSVFDEFGELIASQCPSQTFTVLRPDGSISVRETFELLTDRKIESRQET